jgi:hypothetical protein
MGDVNWLLSSIAQGSAAMIAIVGGLLVSRYVGLHAEQEAVRRRVGDLNARAGNANRLKVELTAELDTLAVADLINDSKVYDALVNSRLTLPLDRLFALVGADRSEFDDDLVAAELRILGRELGHAYEHLAGLIPVAASHPDWAQMRSRHLDLPVHNREAWEWMYSKLCADRRREARANASVWERAAMDVQVPDVLRGLPMPRSDVPSDKRRLLEGIERAAGDERAALQEAELAREAFESSRQPAGFSLALQVLSVLAVLGIAVPVVIMGFAVTTLDLIARVAVIVVFFLGVALLLRYLFVYASFLRDGGRATLPRTVLGLLWKEHRPATSVVDSSGAA